MIYLLIALYVLRPVHLFITPQTVARQAPLSMGFFRQEYWNGLPCPSPGELPDPVIKPASLASSTLADGFFTIMPFREAVFSYKMTCILLKLQGVQRN